MVPYPQIDPVIFQVGPLAVRWYGMMYTLSFLIAWPLLNGRARRWMPHVTPEIMGDLLVWILFGVVLGGRLGYVLFYQGGFYWDHPMAILRVWEGGMSFHGGLLGVLLASFLFAQRRGLVWLALADLLAPVTPIGLFLGRIGNFINGELWGRPTDLPWAMVFPGAGSAARHPSQLYEAGLEGILLFLVLWWIGAKSRPTGFLSAAFLIGYSLCRFTAEFAREPDSFLGFLALGFSMGQWLSIPMFVAGVIMLIVVARRPVEGRGV